MTNGVNSYSLQTVWFASLYNYDQWCEFLFFKYSLVCITV